MAASLNVEHADSLKRQDTFKVVPSDIKRGVNSRNPDGQSAAADYAETVIARAIDIDIHGQLQPCEARRDQDNSLTLTFGFTRADAVELLRTGFDAIDPRTGLTAYFHNPDALLWVKIVDADEKTAFLRGVRENLQRSEITDYQEAKQHEYLRSTFGLSDADIAREYGYTNQNRVGQLRTVLSAPPAIVERVKNGSLAFSVVVNELKGLDAERAEAILTDIESSKSGKINGRINGAAVRKAVRAAVGTPVEEPDTFSLAADIEADTPILAFPVTETEPTEPTKKAKKAKKSDDSTSLKRTRKELTDFFAEVTDESTVAKPKVKALFAALLKFADGSVAEKTLWNRISEL